MRNGLEAQIGALKNAKELQDPIDLASIDDTKLGSTWRKSMVLRVQESKDTAKQIGDIFSNALDGINDSLASTLTGHYHTSRERNRAIKDGLSSEARGVAGKLTKAGLDKAEGSVLGAFGFGNGKKADGSQANPLWVRIAGAVGGTEATLGGSASAAALSRLGSLFHKRSAIVPTLGFDGADPLGLNAKAPDALADDGTNLGLGTVYPV